MELEAGSGLTPGIKALSQLYGFAGSAAIFAVSHIDTLKGLDNPLANRCGQVLEATTNGFGVGHETALLLIGVGQSLLGNPLTGSAIVSAAGNPIAMTCAAVGAIHYGWKALSESERTQLLAAVGLAFKVGTEFVRSIASFAYDMIQTLMSRENFAELKRLVAGAAEMFGRHLSEITKLLSDRVKEGVQFVYDTTENAAMTAWSYAPELPKFRRAKNLSDMDATTKK